MRIPFGAAFCVAALASCTEPVAITYPPAPPPAPPPPAVSAPEPPAPPPAPWALVYQRSCRDSITPPVLSLDGASVASCGAIFSADRGRYLGRAPANLRAFLPEGRAVVDPHQSNGVGVVEPGRSEPREGSGGLLRGLAVSADGARVVSLETAGLTGDRALVVRELPSLRELRKTPLGPGPSLDPALGFLPDGREIVLGAVGCTIEDCTDPAEKKRNPQASCSRPRCPEPTVLVVEGGRASPLSPALSGITAAAFAGERALVVRAGGAVALVELPSGREVATLPWPTDTAPTALALSSSGDRAAVAADGRLTLFARAGASYQPVYTGDPGFTRTLAFAPDGRTLFTGDSLTAYREGATARPTEEPALPITPAPGFTKLRREHGSFLYDGGERSIPTGGVAAYRDEKLGAEVTVVALDADEHDPASDAETWARAVAAREVPYVPFEKKKTKDGPRLEAWGEPGARGALAFFSGDGCDPHDQHLRFQEREGKLWIITLETAPGLSGKRLAAWRAAFMDEPLGAPPAAAHPPAQAKPPGKAKPPAKKKPGKKKGKR